VRRRIIRAIIDPRMDTSGTSEDVHVLACAECPRVSSISARGWKAYRADLEYDEPPRLVFYCPECARRKFESAGP
jgi:hypothetical protein